MSTFRERVEQLLPSLKARGITSLRDWCREANVAESYVNRRMHSAGGRPDFKMMTRLAKAAGVEPAWLAYGEGEPGVPIPTSKPELQVERDPEPVHAFARDPLELAINEAFVPGRHTPSDVLRVVDAWRAFPRKDALDGDLVETAGVWLDSARALRQLGRDADPWSLLERATLGKDVPSRQSPQPLMPPTGAEAARGVDPAIRDLVYGQIAKNMALQEREDARREEAGFVEGEPTTRIGGAKSTTSRHEK